MENAPFLLPGQELKGGLTLPHEHQVGERASQVGVDLSRTTNARCVLSRSYGHEEHKNVNPFSVQKAHKAVRDAQYLRPLCAV